MSYEVFFRKCKKRFFLLGVRLIQDIFFDKIRYNGDNRGYFFDKIRYNRANRGH